MLHKTQCYNQQISSTDLMLVVWWGVTYSFYWLQKHKKVVPVYFLINMKRKHTKLSKNIHTLLLAKIRTSFTITVTLCVMLSSYPANTSISHISLFLTKTCLACIKIKTKWEGQISTIQNL